MIKKEEKRVIIIDKNTDGLELVLSSFNFKVDLATNGKDGLSKLRNNKYDIAIISFKSPLMSGLDVLKAIRGDRLLKLLPVIIVSDESSPQNQITSLNSGADDYLEKSIDILNLLARMGSLLRRVHWHEEKRIELPKISDEKNRENLTIRQVEILKLMSHGYSNKQMAKRLFLSETTVKAHLRSIFKKLDVANRTQAVLVGINHGLIA